MSDVENAACGGWMLRCCSRLQSMAAWQVARYRCAGGAFCSFSFGACLASHFVPLVTDTSEYPLLNLARPLCVLTALDLEDPHSSYWSRSYYLYGAAHVITHFFPVFRLRFAQRGWSGRSWNHTTFILVYSATTPKPWARRYSNKVVRGHLVASTKIPDL